MHCQFLFKVSDLPLHFLNQQLLVHLLIYNWHVFYLPHAGCKSQSRDSFLDVTDFWPNVCAENRLAVATNCILKYVCQFALSVWYVVSLLVTSPNNHLFQEGQTLVDVGSLPHKLALSTSFLDSLTAGQVDQVKFGKNDLFLEVNHRPAFNINCENRMASGRILIDAV